jgi:hypothetical protein
MAAVSQLPPEEREAELDKLARSLPSDAILLGEKMALGHVAKTDSPRGYAAFYQLIHGFPPPDHIMREVEQIYKAHEEGIGCVVFAWRGSWKSVSISATFTAYRIGLQPDRTNVIVSANDDSAEKITKAVAEIIELHPEWKRVFPHIVPDKGRWSTEGFWVLDDSVGREEWAQRQAGVIDPTLVGGGYKSSRLIGKHPTGLLVIDDIHDRDNSSSEREREAVVDILLKTILKTAVKQDDKLQTWLIAVGTPWALDDAYYTLKNTGQYAFISIPAMTRARDGEGIYVDGRNRDGVLFEDIEGWWNLTAPKHFGPNSIIAARAEGKSSFWQMFMLDLATAETGRLRYYTYPLADIRADWPTIGGADPTNTFNEGNDKSSFFALAYVSKLPTGGAVIVGGVLERCSQLQAENHILTAQGKFQNWLYTAVENVGGGAGFIQTLQRNPGIAVIPSGLKGISDAKVRSKKDRVLEMARWFEDSTVRISDEDTPFLNALRRLFDKFHDLDPKHDYSFDAWDATYHALKNLPDVLNVRTYEPVRTTRTSPLVGLRLHKGY